MNQLFLNSIKLTNFRNYAGHHFDFHKKFIFIIGPNASGKSSLLEAIQTIAISTESWTDQEKQLVNLNAEECFFGIEANYNLNERHFNLYLTGGGQGYKSLKLNGVKHRSIFYAREDCPKVVSFRSRESLEIVRGAPSERRSWLDGTLNLLNPHYADSFKRYNRSLEQRNTLLKTFFERGKSKTALKDELFLWDAELSKHGAYLHRERAKFLQEIEEEFKSNYLKIACKPNEETSLNYQPAVQNGYDENSFMQALEARHELDIMRGQTSVGVHRDDFMFMVQNKEVRLYGSQGEQRTCALAIKLVQLHRWEAKLEYAPILLLDDVAAELDLNRQEALFSTLPQKSQVFITTTHLISLPSFSSENYQILNIGKTF
jgi:DNA replication and repair protein RecF